jgi:pyrimidine-specific ribonucleoside hydrolase
MRPHTLLLAAALLLAGCAARGPATEAPRLLAEPLALVVDSDMGADDMLALLFLLRRPDVEMLAVTVSGTGLTTCAAGVPQARALLAAAGREAVPVACGSEAPTAGDAVFPAEWRAAATAGNGLQLPAAPAEPMGDAVELLGSAAASAGRPVTLLALGPLTNVAEALERHQALAGELAAIYVMGGALDAPGNLREGGVDNAVAEWNSYIDPAAAERVFASGVPLALVPLDATDGAPASRELLSRLGRDQGTAEARLAHKLLDAQRELLLAGELYVWDAVAAALMLDESLGQWRSTGLRAVTAAGPELGRVLADGGRPAARVATSIDRARFEGVLVETLNGRLGPAGAAGQE